MTDMLCSDDVISQFRDAMSGARLNTSDHIIADGKLHRFHVEGDPRNKRNGWYVLHNDERPAGVFGCNKRMGAESIRWTAKGLKRLDVEERREIMAKMKADAAKRAKAKELAQIAAAVRANTIWERAAPCESHPYLMRKGVSAYGLRTTEWRRDMGHDKETGEVREVRVSGALLVPIKNAKNEIVSLQAIFPAKNEMLGRDKDFIPGGEKRGCYYPFALSAQNKDKPIIIAEGYATAASIHEATGCGCVVAFDAGNLKPVAEIIRGLAPNRAVIIAADNDQFTKASPGHPENPGLHYAVAAGKATGAYVALPLFEELTGQPTDFNDLHAREGLDAVREQIMSVLAEPQPEPEPEPILDSEPNIETMSDMPPEPPAEETEAEKKARIKAERAAKKEAKLAAAAARAAEYAANPDMFDPSKFFTMLGHDRTKIFVYSHEMKLVVSHGIDKWNKHSMLQIAPPEFWKKFSADPDGNEPPEWDFCENWLIRESYRKGFYDPSKTRGRGAWMDEGRIVYHFGNMLMVDGVETPVTKIDSKFVYEQGKQLPPPSAEPLSNEEGRRIFDTCKMFRWSKPGSAVLLTGWIALAPICGALKWRPHVWVTGAAGSGKTTVLNDFVRVLTAGTAVFSQGNSTEAGIRQKLQSDALPVLFDESEQGDERAEQRVQNVIALARQSSSESGAQTYKGTVTGEGTHFLIRSMFCLSSIAVHIKSDADRDRLTVLALRPRTDNTEVDRWTEIKEALYVLAKDEEFPARLMRRALDLLPITHLNIAVFAAAAAKKFGSQRDGDQYGALMAGTWSLVSGAVATPEQAAKVIDRYDWSDYVEHTQSDDSVRALQALLSAKIRLEHGKEVSVYELISVALTWEDHIIGLDAKGAQKELRKNAIVTAHRVPQLQGTHIAILTSGPEVPALLKGSTYHIDFHGVLGRLPGAIKQTEKQTISINGGTRRGYFIPLTAISRDDAADEPQAVCEPGSDDVPF